MRSNPLILLGVLCSTSIALAQVPPGGGLQPSPRPKRPRPTIEATATLISGTGIKVEQVQRILRRHQGRLRYCVERVVQQGRAPGGVTFRVVASASGRVTRAFVERRTTSEDKTFEECLSRQVRRFRLPTSKGGFVFRMRLRAQIPAALKVARTPTIDVELATARDQARAARAEARCLSRAARRLERAVRAARGAKKPARRQRTLERARAARQALERCYVGRALGTIQPTGVGGLAPGPSCPNCRGAAP